MLFRTGAESLDRRHGNRRGDADTANRRGGRGTETDAHVNHPFWAKNVNGLKRTWRTRNKRRAHCTMPPTTDSIVFLAVSQISSGRHQGLPSDSPNQPPVGQINPIRLSDPGTNIGS